MVRSRIGRSGRSARALVLAASLALLLPLAPTQVSIERALAAPVKPVAAAPAVTTWSTVFYDGFTTSFSRGKWHDTGYAQRWYTYDGDSDTSRNGSYRCDKVLSAGKSVSKKKTVTRMDWYLHTEAGKHLVCAIVPAVKKSTLASMTSMTYGRYSFRFRADAIPGYKLVPLLWPNSDEWSDGEIDFPEVPELTAGNRIYAASFGANASQNAGNATKLYSKVAAAGSGWHTAQIVRLPGYLAFWLDGKQVGSPITDQAHLPAVPMHLVFQVETRNSGAAPKSATKGHIQLDWLRIEKPVLG